MKGWKTFTAAAIFFLLGIADLMNVVDVRSILILMGVPDAKVGGVLAVMGLVFGILRLVTTTPMFVMKEDHGTDTEPDRA